MQPSGCKFQHGKSQSHKAGVEIWTHKVNGLTECDFVLLEKTERAFVDRSRGSLSAFSAYPPCFT